MPALSAVAMFFQDDVTLAHDVHSMMIAQWIIAICILLVILGLVIALFAVLAIVRSVEKKVENATKTVQSKALPLVAQGQDLLSKVQEIVADLKPKIASVSTSVESMVTDIKPKVASVTSDVQHMSGVVKEKVDEVSVTFTKVVGQVTETVNKVTGEVGETVTKVTGQVGDTVTKVNGTVQDVNGKTQAQVARVNGMVSDVLTSAEHVSKSIQHGIRVPIDKMVGWVAAAKTGFENLTDKLPFGFGGDAKPAPKAVPKPAVAPGGPPFVVAPDRQK